MDRVKRIWCLSPMRAAKVQASLRIRAVSPEPSLLAHTSSESRRTFRQKARSLAPLNGWACAVEICHDGMLEDTNSLDGAHMYFAYFSSDWQTICGCNKYSSSVTADGQACVEKKKKNDFVDYMLKRCSVIKKNIISYVFALLVSGHIFYGSFDRYE